MRDPINEELHPYRHDHARRFNFDLAFMRMRPFHRPLFAGRPARLPPQCSQEVVTPKPATNERNRMGNELPILRNYQ